ADGSRARRAAGPRVCARVGARLADAHARPGSRSPLAQQKQGDSAHGAGHVAGPQPAGVGLVSMVGEERVVSLMQRSGETTAPSSDEGHALFVGPRGRGDGFRASVRGHMLELADPGDADGLAPTPDDLFVASIASELAWSARRFLRTRGLPDDVSVSA